ncbi:DUF3795 domain-containing protein [Candidatus Bipolaricaulota bacterium]|nr:DUF3795 domain-containing protein [Candidatus Bipolaricaulota bacterium]
MDRHAFENVRGQIGACGIWCGSCAIGNGSLRLATGEYLQVLEGHGIEHWAPPELDYAAMSNGLSIVSDMATCPGCRQNGGRDDCPMRECAGEKAIHDCTQCAAASCCHSKLLEHMRSGAAQAGLIVKNPSQDDATVIHQGMVHLTTRFPSCLLFLLDKA